MADSASKLNEASARAERTLEDELQRLVGSDSFSRLLAETMGTTMGFARLWSDGLELMLRSLRVPTQGELTRLGRQLARLEDKLEDLLIAVEDLEDRVASQNGASPREPAPRRQPSRRPR